ncbi:MAG TPA: hypothetical protein PLN21_16880, partial [Gemmatales bacterium]|nr:hypothetical protein [Gemmatales bacterium]
GTTFGWISADEARNDEVKERIRADKLADEAQLSREKALEASKASSLQARIAQQKAKEVSRLLGIGRLNEGFSAARDHDYYASLLQFADQKSHFADDNEAITTINHRLSAHWRFGNRPSLSSVILQPRSSNEVRINYSNIYSADLSPDGLRVVTVGNTGPARIWDTDSGIELIPPISHAAPISKTIFTNDGNRLVTTALDGTICVWNSRNGKAITPIMKHGESAVIDAALCPDGTRIVTGSEDHTAQVWNALTGEPIGPRIKHSSIVDHVQYSSNGRFLVTVTGASVRGKSEQSFRKIADMVMIDKTKHFLAMIIDWLPFHSAISSHHCHAISNILYIYTFLTSLTDNHTPSASVTVWDSSRQSSLFRTELPMIITDVRFSNDSSRLLVATLDGNVYLYDLHDRGKVLHVLSNPLQNSPPWQEQRLVLAQFVVSGKMVITANAEGDFRIWDTETGGLFHAFTGRRESVLHAECSHDTRYILATYSDGVVCIYNVLNGLEITSIKCRDSLNQASFSLDDRRIITRSSELIRVWDLSTCRQRPLILEQTAQSGIRFISTGQLFWRNGSAAGLVEIPTRKANAINISSLRDSDSVEVCDTGEIAIVFGKDKIATVWTIRSVPQKLFDLSHPDFVRSATFSHDGTYVATVCLDESVRIWDCRSGKQVGLPIKENMQVRRIAFSNSSHKIAVTTSSDNSNNSNYVQVQLWDAETAKTISNKKYIYDMVSYPGFSNDLGRLIERTADRINIISTISDVSSTTLPDTSMHSGAFLSPDGRFVATTNGGKILRVMESDTGRSLFHPLMNEAWIQYAVFTKDSRYLLTRDANSSLRVWETSLGKAVSPSLTHPASLSEAIVSDTGLYIVARKGDPSGTLYLWDLSLSDFLRDDLLVLSQVYAGAKLDSIGTPSAIQGDILVKAYRELSLKHRSEFKVDHKLALTWRQEEIKICLNEGNISAAFFHQNWLLAEAVLEATKSNAK